ncbi:MAG: type II toxin-antitoxin system VapC family toxin [Proteobacteria bacterium]|nr:type II toxin-antitoxin system VapC family toxin [Pseudomonadota bacterium]
MYLLDTNVLSELRKRKRNPNVANWIRTVPGSELHLSTVVFFEIERGIERQRAVDPAFAKQLSEWLEFTLRAFGDRILPLTVNIARRWGRLSAQIGNKELDLAIAATALEHGLTVVTGNTKHFQRTGVKMLDPFHASARK